MLLQVLSTTFSRSELFSCLQKVDHVTNYIAKGLIGTIQSRTAEGEGLLPLFCWDIFSRAPVDMEKVLVELLDFSLKGGRLEPVVFDESLRTMQFLWKSGMFACPNDYNPMCVQG